MQEQQVLTTASRCRFLNKQTNNKALLWGLPRAVITNRLDLFLIYSKFLAFILWSGLHSAGHSKAEPIRGLEWNVTNIAQRPPASSGTTVAIWWLPWWISEEERWESPPRSIFISAWYPELWRITEILQKHKSSKICSVTYCFNIIPFSLCVFCEKGFINLSRFSTPA